MCVHISLRQRGLVDVNHLGSHPKSNDLYAKIAIDFNAHWLRRLILEALPTQNTQGQTFFHLLGLQLYLGI